MAEKPNYEELEQRIHKLEQETAALERIKGSAQRRMRRYQELVDGLDEVVYRMAIPDGQYEYVSPASEVVFGYGPEKFIENPFFITEILSPEYYESFKQQWPSFLNGNIPKTKEYQIIDPDGNKRWIKQSFKGIFDKQNSIVAVEGLCRNITKQKLAEEAQKKLYNSLESLVDERTVELVEANRKLEKEVNEHRQAEESLQKREDQFRLLAENATDVIWTMDMNLCLTYISPSVLQLRGYTAEEATAQPVDEIMVPESSIKVKTLLNQKLQLIEAGDDEGWAPISFEVELYCKDDTTIITLNNTKILWGSDGRPNMILGVTHDITDKKQAEEALKESEKRYKNLLEASPNAIAIVQGFPPRHLFVNTAFTDLFGYTLNDVENGFSPFKIIQESDRSVLEKLISDRHTGRAVANTYNQYDLAAKNGRIFPCETIGTLINYEGQTADMVVFRDISERIRAEEEKASLEAQLWQAHKMEAVGTLAGGIAHDFNNILGIIVGNTEMSLSDVPEWNPAHGNLKEVQKACLRARDVVRQLLSFSRKSEQKKKPVKIAPIIKETSKLLRASIPSNIDIRYNIPDDLGTIKADLTQIHQIVLNLCTNAADAMDGQDGVLEITLDSMVLDEETAVAYEDLETGPYVRLSVSDTGQGISSAEKARIFDPYFTTKEVGKGTGLGLSVVHGIVKGHKGEITVHSEIGKGTTFEVFFPIIKEEAEKPSVIKAAIPKGDERILFVDDEEAIVELGRKGLKRLGYRVEATTSAQKALAMFRDDPDGFDIVITDMTMPDMSGDKLAEEIMKTRPGIPVVLCTGYSDHISEEKARAMGVSAFMLKPISGKELAVSIRQVLDHSEEGLFPSIRNILVVEDDEQMRSMIRQMLESAGYSVMEAPDGKVALWLFKEMSADLIIIDIIMPEKEGLETIMEFRRDFPDVKIISISGGGLGDPEQYLSMAKKMGADHTLAKPFEKDELLKVVKDLLG